MKSWWRLVCHFFPFCFGHKSCEVPTVAASVRPLLTPAVSGVLTILFFKGQKRQESNSDDSPLGQDIARCLIVNSYKVVVHPIFQNTLYCLSYLEQRVPWSKGSFPQVLMIHKTQPAAFRWAVLFGRNI